MDKNLLLAIVLSTIILVVFYSIFPPTQETEKNAVPESTSTKEIVDEGKNKIESDQTKKVKDEKIAIISENQNNLTYNNEDLIKINTPLYKAEIDSNGGILRSFSIIKL